MSGQTTLRVMIIDDEALARQRIEDLLEKAGDVEIVGRIDNGRAAVEAIAEQDPDLVFLDVQMPGMTGLEVVAAIGEESMPSTIFVTAYDQFALNAFDLAAVDYLVKPFDDDRFETALERARRKVELEEVGAMTRRLLEVLNGEGATRTESAPHQDRRWAENIPVETRGQVRFVPVDRIDYISADGPYAELHVGDKSLAIRERMHVLEERLDPAKFVRIHRSTIVQIDRIERFLRGAGGDYAIRLRGGRELAVSRRRREELARRLGISR